MTSPPVAFAPRTASYGSPGQPPVMRTASRAAIASPRRCALARFASLTSPPLEPITPMVNRMALTSSDRRQSIPLAC